MEPAEPVLSVGDRTPAGHAVPVDAGRAAAFARSLGQVEPGGSGPGTAVAPTLVVALALDSPGGPVDLIAPLVTSGRVAGVVHGDQQLTLHRPVRAGDSLLFSSTVATVRRLPGATMTGITTAVADAAGVPVADLAATFVLPDPA